MRRGRTAKQTLSDLKTGRHPSFIEQKANKKKLIDGFSSTQEQREKLKIKN